MTKIDQQRYYERLAHSKLSTLMYLYIQIYESCRCSTNDFASRLKCWFYVDWLASSVLLLTSILRARRSTAIVNWHGLCLSIYRIMMNAIDQTFDFARFLKYYQEPFVGSVLIFTA